MLTGQPLEHIRAPDGVTPTTWWSVVTLNTTLSINLTACSDTNNVGPTVS